MTKHDIVEMFEKITLLYHDLTSISSKENSQGRFDQTRNACRHLVSYLNCKSHNTQRITPISLKLLVYEKNIISELDSDLTVTDSGIKSISESVGEIQK